MVFGRNFNISDIEGRNLIEILYTLHSTYFSLIFDLFKEEMGSATLCKKRNTRINYVELFCRLKQISNYKNFYFKFQGDIILFQTVNRQSVCEAWPADK